MVSCLGKSISYSLAWMDVCAWFNHLTSLVIFLPTHKSCTYFSGFSKAVGTFSSLSVPPPQPRPENVIRSVEILVIPTCCSSYLESPKVSKTSDSWHMALNPLDTWHFWHSNRCHVSRWRLWMHVILPLHLVILWGILLELDHYWLPEI